MSPRVVLVGMPGAGKTSVGRAVAARLRVPFADSDDLVVRATGVSVRELFDVSEEQFRAAEADAVVDALRSFGGVLALGGGSLLTPSIRTAVLRSGSPVVLLQATVLTLSGRVGDGRSRPLLAGDPAGRLAVLDAARAPLYAEAANVVVETDGRGVAAVADLVVAAL